MIIGIVFVTCLVSVVTIRLITSMLGMSWGPGTAGGACGGAGVVAAILISRRRAALAGSSGR